jgi:hypothetical protein
MPEKRSESNFPKDKPPRQTADVPERGKGSVLFLSPSRSMTTGKQISRICRGSNANNKPKKGNPEKESHCHGRRRDLFRLGRECLTSWRESLTPWWEVFTPGREIFTPGNHHVPPGRINISPKRTCAQPGRINMSPRRIDTPPERINAPSRRISVPPG